MKKILNIILLATSLGFLFSSCGDNDKAEFLLDGEWTIDTRIITCKGEGAAEGKAKTLQTQLEKLYAENKLKYNYIYTFGDIIVAAESRYEYGERIYEKDSDVGIPPMITLRGSYKKTDGGLIAYAENLGSFGNWEQKLKIRDQNFEYVKFEQELTSRDLDIILYVYFGRSGVLDKGITGKLVTIATKNKKTE